MSYILEALRKSEQERNADRVPDLATHHTHIHKQPKNHYFWWILAIAIVLSNGTYLLYKLTEKPQPQETVSKVVIESAQETATATQPRGNNEQQQAEREPAATQQNSTETAEQNIQPQQFTREPVTQNTQPIIAPPVMESKTVSFNKADLPDITELPYTVQQQLPDLDYSTHIHVKEGGSFIIINGKNLGEGMNVDRGLKILQILSDGIVLEFKGRRFFLASMTSWKQN